MLVDVVLVRGQEVLEKDLLRGVGCSVVLDGLGQLLDDIDTGDVAFVAGQELTEDAVPRQVVVRPHLPRLGDGPPVGRTLRLVEDGVLLLLRREVVVSGLGELEVLVEGHVALPYPDLVVQHLVPGLAVERVVRGGLREEPGCGGVVGVVEGTVVQDGLVGLLSRVGGGLGRDLGGEHGVGGGVGVVLQKVGAGLFDGDPGGELVQILLGQVVGVEVLVGAGGKEEPEDATHEQVDAGVVAEPVEVDVDVPGGCTRAGDLIGVGVGVGLELLGGAVDGPAVGVFGFHHLHGADDPGVNGVLVADEGVNDVVERGREDGGDGGPPGVLTHDGLVEGDADGGEHGAK